MEKEKQGKPKNMILRFLPKAASAVSHVSFQNPPFSPGRDHVGKHKAHAHACRGFSGSLIPDEARSKSKSDQSFGTQEPTSPKVSCMGQIKHKKKIKSMAKKSKRVSPPRVGLNPPSSSSSSGEMKEKEKKHASKLRRIFSMAKSTKNKPDVDHKLTDVHRLSDRSGPASLGQMKRFASGRDAFANFDWMAQIAPEEGDDDHDHHNRRDYYSDEERRDSDVEEDEVIIPFSAPITVGGGVRGMPNLQPRKEINLWKRRTMNPPKPLQLNSMVTAN